MSKEGQSEVPGTDIRVRKVEDRIHLRYLIVNREDWAGPSVDMISQQSEEMIQRGHLFLCGWPLHGLLPADLEYLFNFVSGWKENGVENLSYIIDKGYMVRFELTVIIDRIEYARTGKKQWAVTEVEILERQSGTGGRHRLNWLGSRTIDNLIDDVIDLIEHDPDEGEDE